MAAVLCGLMFEGSHAVPALPEAARYLESSDTVTVTRDIRSYRGILFSPVIMNTTSSFSRGFILYPGGFIAPEAYAPMCFNFATLGYPCYVANFPLNAAIFDANQGLKIMRHLAGQVLSWTGVGHSMGGAYIANFALHMEKEEPEAEMAGYVMLDARPATDMTGYEKPTVLIYHGSSRDSPEIAGKIAKAKVRSPPDMKVHELPGGNHAGYAYYADQAGDDVATITKDEQIERTIAMILETFA